MNKSGNDLLLSLANLSQYKKEETVLRKFIESLDQIYPHLNIDYSEDSGIEVREFEISTPENHFGFLRAEKKPEKEEIKQITSATRMLAVILQSIREKNTKDVVAEPTDSHGIIESARDITEQKQAQEKLQESNKRLELFLQISRRITDSSFDQAGLMQAIVDNAVKAIDIDSCAIYLLQNQDKIRLEATFPALSADFPEKYRLASLRYHPHIRKAFKSCMYVVMPDVQTATLTEAEKEIVRLRGLRSVLYIPIVLRGQSIGVLILSSIDEPHAFYQEEISLLQNFANQAAQIFDNVRNYEKSQKHAQELKQEIIERREAEVALKKEQKRLAHIIEGTNAGTWEWNVQTEETVFNERWAEMIGYTLEELSPISINTWMNNTHPDDLKACQRALDSHFRGEKQYYECECRMKHKKGNWVWILDRGKVISWTEDGKPQWMFGTHLDITERKKAEEKLKQSEERFKALFHQNSSVLILIDPQTGDIYDANNQAVKFYGYSRKELCNLNMLQINTLPEDYVKEEMEKAHREEKQYFTFSHRLANGEVRDVEVFSGKIKLENKELIYSTVHDITEQARNRRMLQKGEEIAKIGHWEFDLNNNKVNTSEGARKIYGLKSKELTIPEVQKIPLEAFRPELDKALRALIEENERYNVEFKIQRPTDKKIIDIHSIAEYNQDRNIVFGIIQDITERKEFEKQLKQKNEELQTAEEELRASNEELRAINQRLEEQAEALEEAKKKAEESDRLKSAFLANMSHEIRTPINGIMGFTQLLSENDYTAEQQKMFLDIIHSRTRHLLRLINDIVDVSKIEAGQLTLNYQDFSINDLLYELYNIYKTELNNANKTHIDFQLSLPVNSQNWSLHSDANRLRQILDNFINNAIKFTDEGKIEFGYYLQSNQAPVFYVKDTGIGISNQYQQCIFERFRQLDDSTGRIYEGTGLGLTISKNLSDLMGGEIWMESTKGKGSIFYFSLPAKIKNRSGNSGDEEQKNLNWEGKTILIVEDDPASLEFMREILRSTGANLLLKETGKDGLWALNNSGEIDLILMDIRLPDISGTEIIKKIRERNHEMPIIAQTAHAMEKDREKCIQAGANGYIAKPIDINQLFSVINQHVT